MSESAESSKTEPNRVIKLALAFANASADDDAQFERARLAFLRAARAYGMASADRARSEVLREALAAAKARGVRVGRPPVIDPQELQRQLEQLGSTTAVARALGAHPATVRRAVSKLGISRAPCSP